MFPFKKGIYISSMCLQHITKFQIDCLKTVQGDDYTNLQTAIAIPWTISKSKKTVIS